MDGVGQSLHCTCTYFSYPKIKPNSTLHSLEVLLHQAGILISHYRPKHFLFEYKKVTYQNAKSIIPLLLQKNAANSKSLDNSWGWDQHSYCTYLLQLMKRMEREDLQWHVDTRVIRIFLDTSLWASELLDRESILIRRWRLPAENQPLVQTWGQGKDPHRRRHISIQQVDRKICTIDIFGHVAVQFTLSTYLLM